MKKTLTTLFFLMLLGCSTYGYLDNLHLPDQDLKAVRKLLREHAKFKVKSSKWLDESSIEVEARAGTIENGAKQVILLRKEAGIWKVISDEIEFYDPA